MVSRDCTRIYTICRCARIRIPIHRKYTCREQRVIRYRYFGYTWPAAGVEMGDKYLCVNVWRRYQKSALTLFALRVCKWLRMWTAGARARTYVCVGAK